MTSETLRPILGGALLVVFVLFVAPRYVLPAMLIIGTLVLFDLWRQARKREDEEQRWRQAFPQSTRAGTDVRERQ